MKCKFCEAKLLYKNEIGTIICHNCKPNISYFFSNLKSNFIIVLSKDYKTFYRYHFDTSIFSIQIIDNDNSINYKNFENIKLLSSKEMESFGDRIQKLLIFS